MGTSAQRQEGDGQGYGKPGRYAVQPSSEGQPHDRHTEGGICYLTDNIVFTGDTLFRLSVGNTSLETGDWPTMVKSIQEKLYTLDDDTIVYPGHGPATQIGYEKRSNPFV